MLQMDVRRCPAGGCPSRRNTLPGDREVARMAPALDGRVGSAQPRTLPQLLRMLGINDKPVGQQWHPIMAWLEHNGASRELWMSLLANGYGIHLERDLPSFNRPVPRRTRPPQSCPHGHLLRPGAMLVGHQPCSTCCGGHTTWTCPACGAMVYWPPLRSDCRVLAGPAAVR